MNRDDAIEVQQIKRNERLANMERKRTQLEFADDELDYEPEDDDE